MYTRVITYNSFTYEIPNKDYCLGYHTLVQEIASGKCNYWLCYFCLDHNIIVLSGAGISVSAGIPDFRTPGTGIYYKVQKYELDDPQDVFTIEFVNFLYCL